MNNPTNSTNSLQPTFLSGQRPTLISSSTPDGSRQSVQLFQGQAGAYGLGLSCGTEAAALVYFRGPTTGRGGPGKEFSLLSREIDALQRFFLTSFALHMTTLSNEAPTSLPLSMPSLSSVAASQEIVSLIRVVGQALSLQRQRLAEFEQLVSNLTPMPSIKP